ncbi:DUF3515 family protein [Microbacterium halotolerans]|uniref:DUF3515 family protein n=1 Tax=Microbacterium halotolerans TaxID=246613 RepID=UPI001F0960BC|nr:DUF3515 family protein [Microbacterium halotolerans]
MIHRAFAAVLVAVAAATALAGCAHTVALEPQPQANDPLCAEVSVRLPDTIGDQARRWTDAQATAAWGDDSGTSIIFACGKEPPAPSTLQCVTIGGVDWIVDESEQPNLLMTTYGRSPAAEIYVDTTKISSNEALQAVTTSAQQLPSTGECTTADEATKIPEDAPTTSGGDD